jgi:hypothetical protein
MENREGEGEEVVEERRKIERKRGRRKNQSLLSPMKVLSLKLRKKMLNTRQRLKTKVELAIKFSPPRILSWIRHCCHWPPCDGRNKLKAS